MAATDPLVPGARARALREYVSVPESTNIARLRAFAADMWIALVRRNEIASEKAMEKPGDCKFFSVNTTGVSLQPEDPPFSSVCLFCAQPPSLPPMPLDGPRLLVPAAETHNTIPRSARVTRRPRKVLAFLNLRGSRVSGALLVPP